VFPNGKYDDQVDSTAQFLEWFKRPSSFDRHMEFLRLWDEAAQAAARPRKPQPAPPDPARGSLCFVGKTEKFELTDRSCANDHSTGGLEQ
jgi:hypothetical protein